MLTRVLAVVVTLVCLCVCPCVCHTPVLYRNGCMDRCDFFAYRFPPISVLWKLGYLKNKGTSLWNVVPNYENIATAHRPSASAIYKQRQRAVWC